jgi:uncharacterized membrane protein YbaN (DUF454 family)
LVARQGDQGPQRRVIWQVERPVCGVDFASVTFRSKLHDSRLMRLIYLWLGFAALLLGALGVVLPVLPTTPFVLLAAACFARSSARFHQHLLTHRIAGPIVREWEQHRSMPPGVKPWAFVLMGVSFGVSIFLVPSPWHRAMLVGIAIVLGIFLWRVPVRNADPPRRG